MIIKQFAADAVTRCDIRAPIACNSVWVRYDGAAMTIRSASGDASSEDTVAAGVPWGIDGLSPGFDPRSYVPSPRFSAGDLVASALLASGSGFIVGTFS